jgi:hypothetical protein
MKRELTMGMKIVAIRSDHGRVDPYWPPLYISQDRGWREPLFSSNLTYASTRPPPRCRD